MIAKKNQKITLIIELENDRDIEIFKDVLDIATDTYSEDHTKELEFVNKLKDLI